MSGRQLHIHLDELVIDGVDGAQEERVVVALSRAIEAGLAGVSPALLAGGSGVSMGQLDLRPEEAGLSSAATALVHGLRGALNPQAPASINGGQAPSTEETR